MFMICLGNVVDGFTFTGPFLDHDSALAYIEDDDDQWNIVPLNTPNEDSGSVQELLVTVGDILTVAAEESRQINENKVGSDEYKAYMKCQIERMKQYAEICKGFNTDEEEEDEEDDDC